MKKIAIIGAGISGLFIANLFKENPDYSLSIYEKNSSIDMRKGMEYNYLQILLKF
jgi:salicylate hydroxylase